MIARWAALVVVAASLGGCTGSQAPSSTTTPPTAGSVTVTATVTPPTTKTTTSASTSPGPTGPARCDAPELTVSLSEAQGAAGTAYFAVVFRNGGEQPCYLRGFPGVSAADDAAAAKVDATRDTTRAAVRVVLQPGQAAHAVLAVSNVPPDGKACPTFPLVLVTPPDSRRTQRVITALTPCGRRMRIGVVLPGASVS